MKKSAAEEPKLNQLARKVGHAVGTIEKATQRLASRAAAAAKRSRAKLKKAIRSKPKKTARRASPKRRAARKRA